MRQSQSIIASRKHNKLGYKDDHGRARQHYSGPNPPTRLAAAVALGIMVSAWLIVKALVAFAPLTSYAQYANTSLPLLLDVTGEELTLGLEEGHFTSVDLVQVRTRIIV